MKKEIGLKPLCCLFIFIRQLKLTAMNVEFLIRQIKLTAINVERFEIIVLKPLYYLFILIRQLKLTEMNVQRTINFNPVLFLIHIINLNLLKISHSLPSALADGLKDKHTRGFSPTKIIAVCFS